MKEGRVARGTELGERRKIHPGGFQLQSVLNELQLALLFLAEKVRRTLFVEQKVGYDLFELLILVPQFTHFARLARRSAVVPASPTIERGLGDSQFPAHLDCWRSGFDLPECLYDFVLSEFAWPHLSILHRCVP
jgi:hypothetical protein